MGAGHRPATGTSPRMTKLKTHEAGERHSTGQQWVAPGGDEMGRTAARSLSRFCAFHDKVRRNKDLRPSRRRGTGQP